MQYIYVNLLKTIVHTVSVSLSVFLYLSCSIPSIPSSLKYYSHKKLIISLGNSNVRVDFALGILLTLLDMTLEKKRSLNIHDKLLFASTWYFNLRLWKRFQSRVNWTSQSGPKASKVIFLVDLHQQICDNIQL